MFNTRFRACRSVLSVTQQPRAVVHSFLLGCAIPPLPTRESAHMPHASFALPVTAAVATATIGLGLIAVPLSSAQAVDSTPTPTPTPTAPPTPTPTVPTISTWPSQVLVGTSNQGRPIYAQRQGNPSASKVMLAVGVIHGNEKAGKKIISAVRATPFASDGDVQIWTIPSMNPDGLAANKRRNARSVDLNRNFPTGWSRKTTGAGVGPASEPETRALMSFIARLRPDATFVYHQDWNMVLGACNWKTRPYALRYAQLTGLGKEKCARVSYTGTMGSWVNSNFPGYMLTVELPGSRKVTAKKVVRWRNSLVTASRELVDLDLTPSAPEPDTESPSPSASPSGSSSS